MTAAALLLACGGGIGLFQTATPFVRVTDNKILIAGPSGYCVTNSATNDTKQGAFVLLGSCASLANNAGVAAPRIPGALTASISNNSDFDITRDLRRLSGFFKSPLGQMALARDGNASSVRVLSTRRSNGVFTIKVRDTSPNDVTGLSPEYWRALFDIQGSIITLTVNAFQNNPMTDADGFATLADFVARVRRENPTSVDQAFDPV